MDDRVLDPAKAQGRVAITLTSRLISRLNKHGGDERVEERQLSISDGSMSNPKFDEIDSFLQVSNRPALPKATEIRTRTAEPTLEELEKGMLG